MHAYYHQIIAFVGGLLFIVFGIARQRERKRLIAAGVKVESALLWDMFIILGLCFIAFAVGIFIYQINKS
jgi:hypothetical protein